MIRGGGHRGDHDWDLLIESGIFRHDKKRGGGGDHNPEIWNPPLLTKFGAFLEAEMILISLFSETKLPTFIVIFIRISSVRHSPNFKISLTSPLIEQSNLT